MRQMQAALALAPRDSMGREEAQNPALSRLRRSLSWAGTGATRCRAAAFDFEILLVMFFWEPRGV